MNRSCQRQTAVLAIPATRMISAVPQPSAVRSRSFGVAALMLNLAGRALPG